MNKVLLILLCSLLSLFSRAQNGPADSFVLSISPLIDQDAATNRKIIPVLRYFLQTKNNSLTQNTAWLPADVDRYIYPYMDLYQVESSKFGADFFKPVLMEILDTRNANRKIIKIAFAGYDVTTRQQYIKLVFNLMANIEGERVLLSRYLEEATADWKRLQKGSIQYIISPGRQTDQAAIARQAKDIDKLCTFFQCKPIDITYYSCVNPKELFQIKGFDYHPMMYADQHGGMADYGNIIFSGNNTECYTHEIIHIYTQNLFPGAHKFIDEGIATYLAGSGLQDYASHRDRLAKWLQENPGEDLALYTDIYERHYIGKETSIPYLLAALVCERTYRLYGKTKLLDLLQAEPDQWRILERAGLNRSNFNETLRAEIKRSLLTAQ